MPLLQTRQSYVETMLRRIRRQDLSLSSYFPKGTSFFYGYPSGESSGFLNLVPPEVEELVAARVVCCAGSGVTPVCFQATTADTISNDLLEYFGIPKAPESSVVFPASISSNLQGTERNAAVRDVLKHQVRPGSFVMAQPYLGDDMDGLYQIPPSVTAYFNDKHHMPEYIGAEWLPKRLQVYENGAQFASTVGHIAIPAVIKVSSSSSGDGVCICTKPEDVESAIERFRSVSGRVFVEEHIEYTKSYGVHFGIPADPKKAADIIGINEQITTVHGAFLGGIIEHFMVPPALEGAVKHLLEYVIPRVRDRGWYGIGGFDILVDEHDNAYFIDANFRMTGMSAYHFLIDRGIVKRPMMSVMGAFTGDEAALRAALGSYAAAASDGRYLKMICLSRNGNTWRFNAALEYSNDEELLARVNELLAAGVESEVLETVRRSL